MPSITISKIDGVLSVDKEHTYAGRSQIVHWHPDPSTGVNSVTAVTMKSESPNTTQEVWGGEPSCTEWCKL